MSDQTLTHPTDTPGAGFAFTLWGATTEVTTPKMVTVPPEVRAMLAEALSFLTTQPNTYRVQLTIPDNAPGHEGKTGAALAAELRAQIESYAIEQKLNFDLPEFIDAHTIPAKDVPAKVDENGKVTEPAKHIDARDVPANKIPKHWNTGNHVAFRITRKATEAEKSAKSTRKASDVTVTHTAPVPPKVTPATVRPRSRRNAS